MKERAAHTKEMLSTHHDTYIKTFEQVNKALDKLASYERLVKSFIDKRDALDKMVKDPQLFDVDENRLCDYEAQLHVLNELLGGKYNGNTTAN